MFDRKDKTEDCILYISPTTDFGFKKIFGTPEIMMSFLNALFEDQNVGLKVTSLVYLDKESDGDEPKSRRTIFDMRCTAQNGEEFLVEMQNQSQPFFDNRIIYYMSRGITIQGKNDGKSDLTEEDDESKLSWYSRLKPVYGVFLMNFYDSKIKKKITHACWIDKDSDGVVVNELQQYFKIQMPFYRESRLKPEDCKSHLDYWMFNLTNMGTMKTAMPFIEQDSGLALMNQVASFHTLSESEQFRYLTDRDDEMVWRSVVSEEQEREIRHSLAVSRAEGRAMGLAEGRAEGRAEGITQGVAEEKQRNYIELLNMAKEMKRKNYPLDDIIAFTKLSREEIEAL